ASRSRRRRIPHPGPRGVPPPRRRLPTAGPSLRQPRAGTQAVAVAEWPALAADDLVILVPLSGDEHGVARARFRERRVDRARAVALDEHLAGPADPAQDHRDNAVGVFAAWVVVGDDDAIREPLGGLAHERALAG